MSEPIHVVAQFEVTAAGVAPFIEAATRLLVAPTRAEPGCLRYELCQDLAVPTRFAMIETWDSAAALETHLAQPALASALDVLRPHVAGAPRVMRLRAVGG